jgi:hypothetical protein
MQSLRDLGHFFIQSYKHTFPTGNLGGGWIVTNVVNGTLKISEYLLNKMKSLATLKLVYR